ncbi:hypothetical protein SERLA73DRAFT_159414 [Serpula lacrymans var. lacrymans S7.3]|uniref:Uncharacterized protein n=1 Tax=Serpula lacrymans var. lacrymans (strain S7.3) TaxID=936435 RepID=F8PS30_SERL3|nr:hypothetical protein SERLA73DRAFT_159414 [Serpula lacrymans var. lacrymans S7.3]
MPRVILSRREDLNSGLGTSGTLVDFLIFTSTCGLEERSVNQRTGQQCLGILGWWLKMKIGLDRARDMNSLVKSGIPMSVYLDLTMQNASLHMHAQTPRRAKRPKERNQVLGAYDSNGEAKKKEGFSVHYEARSDRASRDNVFKVEVVEDEAVASLSIGAVSGRYGKVSSEIHGLMLSGERLGNGGGDSYWVQRARN